MGGEGYTTYLQYLVAVHTPRDVYLVGKDKKTGPGQALHCLSACGRDSKVCGANLFLQQTVQFQPAVLDPLAVGGVHDPDEGIGLLKVVPPVGPQCLLPPDVPCVGQSPSVSSHNPWMEDEAVWHTDVQLVPAVWNQRLGKPAAMDLGAYPS